MLQQTRVEAVIPYYERFLEKFPDVGALAAAPEHELLTAWAGLGYYSRVRNMHRAARRMAQTGGFPSHYKDIRALPGIGDYTAAAVSSIAFGLPHAVLDGNVMRVLSRVSNDDGDVRLPATRSRLLQEAENRLDRRDPGTFNQAIMELGATLCTPTSPKCLLCPVEQHCQGRRAGRENELPVKSRPGDRKVVRITLLIIEQDACILLWQRPADSRRLAGFWELPELVSLPSATLLESVGEFRHGITNTSYTITVSRARVDKTAPEFVWVPFGNLAELPLSTTARKAINLCS